MILTKAKETNIIVDQITLKVHNPNKKMNNRLLLVMETILKTEPINIKKNHLLKEKIKKQIIQEEPDLKMATNSKLRMRAIIIKEETIIKINIIIVTEEEITERIIINMVILIEVKKIITMIDHKDNIQEIIDNMTKMQKK